MLAACLASVAAQRLPDGVSLTVIIVENDDAKRSAKTVEAFARKSGLAPRYVMEPELGIPQARNRALDEAMASDCDLLAMLDDDEQAAADWLSALVEAYRASSAALIGGPVALAPPGPALGRWHRFIHRGMAQRKRFYERRNARRGGERRMPVVVTNNWLCDLSLVRAHGLRFDEALRFAGGEDVAFHKAVVATGASTDWAPGAKVRETVPRERLTLGYVAERAKGQATRKHAFNRRADGALAAGLAAVREPIAIVMRWVALGALLPFTPAYSLVGMAHEYGRLIGTWRGLSGAESLHYKAVTGA